MVKKSKNNWHRVIALPRISVSCHTNYHKIKNYQQFSKIYATVRHRSVVHKLTRSIDMDSDMVVMLWIAWSIFCWPGRQLTQLFKLKVTFLATWKKSLSAYKFIAWNPFPNESMPYFWSSLKCLRYLSEDTVSNTVGFWYKLASIRLTQTPLFRPVTYLWLILTIRPNK